MIATGSLAACATSDAPASADDDEQREKGPSCASCVGQHSSARVGADDHAVRAQGPIAAPWASAPCFSSSHRTASTWQNRRTFLATLGVAALGLGSAAGALGPALLPRRRRASWLASAWSCTPFAQQAATDLAGTLAAAGEDRLQGGRVRRLLQPSRRPRSATILDQERPHRAVGARRHRGDRDRAAPRRSPTPRRSATNSSPSPSLPRGPKADRRRLEAGRGAIQQGGRRVQGRRVSFRVSQPQRHRSQDRRRAADRHPDEGDGSGARVVRDGHLLGGERRRESVGAARRVSRALQDAPRQGLDGRRRTTRWPTSARARSTSRRSSREPRASSTTSWSTTIRPTRWPARRRATSISHIWNSEYRRTRDVGPSLRSG